MAALTGQTVKDTYPGIIKTNDSGARGAEGSADQLSDGAGNTIPLFVSATEVYSTGSNLGTSNTAFGKGAGVDLASGGNYNIFIGEDAGNDATTLDNNVAIGYQCFDKVTTHADNNVAIGFQVMHGMVTTTDSNDCVAIGSLAMSGSLESGSAGTVAIGKSALSALGSGAGNVAIGYQSLDAQTDGNYNTAIGYQALSTMATGEGANVAIGYKAGFSIVHADSDYNVIIGTEAGTGGAAAMSGCIVVGDNAMNSTAGNAQTGTIAIGRSALTALTDGDGNLAIGSNALDANQTSDYNLAIGSNALGALTKDGSANNIAIGHSAGLTLASGASNILIGRNALKLAALTESFNIAIGQDAMSAADEGSAGTIDYNIAIGQDALTGGDLVDTTAKLEKCIAIGANTLNSTGTALNAGNTAQTGTIAIGHDALTALTTGTGNIAVGYQALMGNTTGTNNVAIGYGAMDGSGGATVRGSSNNVFIGYNAGSGTWETAVCDHNVGIGSYALDSSMNGAVANTCVGTLTGSSVTTGTKNTCIGGSSGGAITTGQSNTCIGKDTADTLTTGSYNTLLGHAAGVDAVTDSYHVRLGHYGGVKYFTARVTLDDSYTGTPADGDAAHSNALFVIPNKSYISKVYVTVITLSANADADFMIVYDDTLNVASGAAISGYTEILGAGAESNAGIKVRSHDAQTAASDVGAGSGDVLLNTWVSDIDVTVDNSVGWVDTDVGIYITHTKANTTSDGGADAVIQLTVEYTGV